MTGFVVAIAALTLCGLVILAIPYVRALDAAARMAIAFAAGMLLASVVMFADSLLDIAWSPLKLIATLLPAAIAGVFLMYGTAAPCRTPGIRHGAAVPYIGIPVLLTLIAALSARETCSDLIHFWGPKAIHFWIAKKIDTGFLGYTFYFLMHPDYPPLLTLVYAWGATMARHFSWWGALALTPVMLLATAVAFRGIAARAIGSKAANLHALLLASVLALAYQIGPVAGVGEPPLILFLTIAVAALTFAPGDRGAMILASVMLAAAAFTKVEGAAFAVVVAIAFAIAQRRIVAPLLMLVFPAALLGSWILFAKHWGLLDAYSGREHVHLHVLPYVLKTVFETASYGAFYLPWLALLAAMAFGARRWRPAALPLLVTAGSIAALVFFYIHSRDPWFWIASSSTRVLLTPLMSLAVATAAASE